jgi:hypothetical protein
MLEPFSDHTYRVKLRLRDQGQILDILDYVDVNLFGRTQTWKSALWTIVTGC